MLAELHVTNLGIIDDTTVVLGPGLTAITGETGAGKTLLVDAIALLLGGRADSGLVRRGASEARVEGRFVDGNDGEIVVARVVPADRRSRAYIDGRLATVGELAELSARFIDLHGQHAQVRLLEPAAQRAVLDGFAGPDALAARRDYRTLRTERRELEARLTDLGGDTKARAREIDLLRFKIDEIDTAAIAGANEDEVLEAEEELLAHAAAHQEALDAAYDLLGSAAADAVGRTRTPLDGRAPFGAIADRVRAVEAELADLVSELRHARETVQLDPERLAAVQSRRGMLRELRRKYGDSLGDVLEYATATRARLADLESHDAIVAEIEQALGALDEAIDEAAHRLHALRSAAADPLAAAVTARLADLALPHATVAVEVERSEWLDDGADTVEFGFAANPGESAGPLARVASGGELSRVMLALRVTAGSDDVDTSVFDEIDAGIGGEAGVAVGRTLAELARGRQVLCVTHLPQVAAFADAQVVVTKSTHDGRTVASSEVLLPDARVDELARMLAGVASDSAREHARELLSLRSEVATPSSKKRRTAR